MSNLFYLFKIINHHQILEILTVITTIDPNEQIELNEPIEEQDESSLFIEEEDPFPRGVFLGDPWPVPPSPSSDLSELNKPNLAPSEGKFVGNSFSTYGIGNPTQAEIQHREQSKPDEYDDYGEYVEFTKYNDGGWGCLGEVKFFDGIGRYRK